MFVEEKGFAFLPSYENLWPSEVGHLICLGMGFDALKNILYSLINS